MAATCASGGQLTAPRRVQRQERPRGGVTPETWKTSRNDMSSSRCRFASRSTSFVPFAVSRTSTRRRSSALVLRRTSRRPQQRHQRYHAVVLRLQALGELGDRRPFAARVALDLQQQQVMQRRGRARASPAR
jgi:hypothetical protein